MKKKKFGSLEVWRFGVMLIALSSILYPLSVLSAVPLSWDVDVTRVAPVTFDAYHGETLALEAVFKDASRPLDLTGKTANLYWQTNGMESVYWATNATVSATNHIAATFTGAMDPGAASVRGFLGIAGENYRASFVIRFRPSPGYDPASLPLPTRTLDFATTAVANPDAAPFVRKGGAGGIDEATVTNIADTVVTNHVTSGYLCTAANAQAKADAAQAAAIADAAGKYLPLDGSGTMSGVIRFSSGCRIDTTDDSGGYIILEAKHIRAMTGPEDSSDLTTDGTPVLTEGLAKSTFPIVTNAYTKAEADAKYLSVNGGTVAAPLEVVGTDLGEVLVIDGAMLAITNRQDHFWFRVRDGGTKDSALYPDNSPVATSNMVNGIVPQFIDHTLPRFSNEVLAVGLNIDTNAVAVLNEIAATFGGFPVEGTATTVGGLLAALAAAVAWLKKKKIDKLTCTGVSDITTDNGTANLSALFTSANTSLMGVARYSNGSTSSATMADRTTNVYTLNAPEVTVTLEFPAAVENKMRDFLLDLTYTAGTLQLPEGVTKVGDDLTFTAGKEYLLAFTEISANRFYVRSIEIA